MKTNAEKRACERHCYAADIAFSYFNKEHSYDAQIQNLGTGGMCFKSSFCPLPGATLYIRIKKIHPNGSCPGFNEGIRSVALAEVKWCNQLPGSKTLPFGVGVKYFEPVY